MKKLIFLFFVSICQLSNAQVFEVDTLLWSGTSDNRINIVILGDGYQSSEFPKFISNANQFTNVLFSETPYKEYQNYFNVFAIKVASNESGASHPGTAPDVAEPAHPVSIVDNYFGSSFDSYNIHRLLVAKNTVAINNVLAMNFPTYDQVIMLVNSPYYGGSGGKIALASLEASSDKIALHELGHSFASLADEYYAGDVYARESLNMTQETDPNSVKWKNWMNNNGVGIYQHCCGGNSSDWYRPHQECKMRYLGYPFCSVCIEGIIEKIHYLITPIDSYSPQNTNIIDSLPPITFNVNVIEPIPNTLKIEWSLNGTVLNNSSYSTIVSLDDLLVGSNKLQVTIEDTTSMIRVDNHQSIHLTTIFWNINSTTSGINEISSNTLKVEVFPNPTQDVLHFNLLNSTMEDYKVTISDTFGKQIISKNISSSDLRPQVQLGNLPSGVYFINFSFNNGLYITRKIMKK